MSLVCNCRVWVLLCGTVEVTHWQLRTDWVERNQNQLVKTAAVGERARLRYVVCLRYFSVGKSLAETLIIHTFYALLASWLVSHPWTTTLLWALLTLLTQVWGFNLDTTHTLHKLGDHGTFFGFSLALHQQLTPEPQSWWVGQCGTECSLCVLCVCCFFCCLSCCTLHTIRFCNLHLLLAQSHLYNMFGMAVKSWNLSCVATTVSIF